MGNRLFEPLNLGLILLVGLFLAVLYLVASAVKEHRRKTERHQLEQALRKQETPVASPPAPDPTSESLPPAIAVPLSDAPSPTVVPPDPTPRPRFLLAWKPTTTDPPQFRQYITWPGTKLMTPLVEQPPSDRDYVWQ